MGTLTVVGSGNVGQAIAGHLTLEGHEVRIYSPWESEFGSIAEHGGIELSGEVTGLAVPHLMTTDLARAVAGADVVLIAVPAFAHRQLSASLARVLEPEQLVVFHPSAFGAGLELAREFIEAGRKACTIAETATSLYTCRIQRPAHVYIGRIKPSVKIATTPSDAVIYAQEQLRPFFGEGFLPERDALTVGMSRVGALYHVPPALFNFKTVEDGDERPHNTLVTPGIAELIDALDQERLSLADKLGVHVPSFREFLEQSYGVAEGSLSERIQAVYGPLNFPEPNSPSHRYFTEDIPYSLVPWSSLAEQIDHPMPLTDSIITTSSILCGRDWSAEARTARVMGLVGSSADEIRDAFRTGGN